MQIGPDSKGSLIPPFESGPRADPFVKVTNWPVMEGVIYHDRNYNDGISSTGCLYDAFRVLSDKKSIIKRCHGCDIYNHSSRIYRQIWTR